MELNYLVARSLGKRVLFFVLPREEEFLREKLALCGAKVLFSGTCFEDDRMLRKCRRLIRRVDRWVVTTEHVDSEWMSDLFCRAHVSGAHVSDLDSYILEIDPTVPARSPRLIHLLAAYGTRQDRMLTAYVQLKSFLEPALAIVLCILLAPVFLAVALLVKFTSSGPVIYSQERVGLRGRIFRIYKFRSMVVDAEKGKAAWARASKTDPNLTPIGAFLRSSHLDELPQLWNVIRGEVGFIGPRPERPEFERQLSALIPLFGLRLLMKPGITGWAQVHQGYANSIEDSLRKLELDLFYVIKHSPLLDLKIVFLTLAVLCTGGTEGLKRMRAMRSPPAPLLAATYSYRRK